MQVLLGISIAAMVVADAAAGLRLLALSLRTRRLPEAALACALLMLGAVGYPLSIVARRSGGEGAVALLGVALAAQNLACLAVLVFTRRTFRPGSRAAGLAVGLCALAFGVSLAAPLVGVTGSWDEGWPYWLAFGVRAAAFAWTSVEAWRSWAGLGRQLRLGLADAVVVDRMRLWGLATACVFLAFVLFGIARVLGLDVASSPPVIGATSLVGVTAGATIWLAFLPPRAYVARVAARAAARSGS